MAEAYRHAERVASAFVAARRAGVALAAFPGQMPDDLVGAYACQDTAIELWNEPIVGWKVGGVPPADRARLGATRVAGPIFRSALRHADMTQSTSFPVFSGGFAAVEAEFTVRLANDAPADQRTWTSSQAAAMIDAVFISVETAGSPLASINALGPIAVAADFGNNAGLIVGAPITGWEDRRFESVVCRSSIEQAAVGSGTARSLTKGPFESVRFLLECCARRGRPLKAGTLIATGAVTGIHQIGAGQEAHITFGPYGSIRCKAEEFRE